LGAGVLVSLVSVSYMLSPLSFYFSLSKSVRLISLLGSLILCLGKSETNLLLVGQIPHI
jgi:hypothetical protein